ncbi:GNAT family N-acetyltransferase [Desulfobacterota bacterium AH_259_B03_O07]|nr:GNAT family N-acetyltransferase [Desulfobacterota bacterium AH_259_B03_O07]
MLAQKVASIKDSVFNFNMFLKAYRWKLRQFKPKVLVFYENRKFIIKSAENAYELEQALNLRYEVFYKEVLNKRAILQIDIDSFDLICDHLIIIDKKSEKVIGTYRFISSTYSEVFYSETEFSIDNLKRATGNKLELGRACVHKDYRTGIGIALLWKGLSEYMKKVDAQYLFGCSSVNTTNTFEIGLLYKYLKELYFSPEELRVYPNEKNKIRQFDLYLNAIGDISSQIERIEELIPALLRGYLKAGSKVCGEPALDWKFGCADFFTILDLERMNKLHEKKYNNKEKFQP